MLHRSLGAGSFARFWLYWNPIWGYALGRYIHAPLRRFLPSALALVLTFVVSGAIHDLVATIVRGEPYVLFTLWFLLMSIAVLVGQYFSIVYAAYPFIIRAAINLSIVSTCFALALGLRQLLIL
jgi:hypothetical protein